MARGAILILLLCTGFTNAMSYPLNGIHSSKRVDLDDELSYEDNYNDRGEPLIVNCDVNGFSIPAIIDTGAQMSVMSESCMRRCHLINNLDTRHAGKVVGVGKSDIIGRIDSLPVRIGPVAFRSKISVLRDSRVDFLIGMDLLNKFDCEINIKDKWIKLKAHNRYYKVNFEKSPVCDTLPMKNENYQTSFLKSKLLRRLVARAEAKEEEDVRMNFVEREAEIEDSADEEFVSMEGI